MKINNAIKYIYYHVFNCLIHNSVGYIPFAFMLVYDK
jgi:hypothetical protein